jgi:hypothetical protein
MQINHDKNEYRDGMQLFAQHGIGFMGKIGSNNVAQKYIPAKVKKYLRRCHFKADIAGCDLSSIRFLFRFLD